MGMPAYAEGLKLAAAGRHAEAIVRFEAALCERANDPRILFALANTARDIGHTRAAENLYGAVLAAEPDRIEALVNLANLLRSQNRTEAVIALIRPALERKPESAELWLTLGSALREAGDTKSAQTFYQEALRLKPGYGQAIGNLADLLADMGEVDQALALYERVVDGDPHFAQARLNRAILLLLQGRLSEGWRDYAYRLKLSGALRYDHHLAKWTGGALKGARLLVTAEQGLGDQLAFASVIPDLADLAALNGSTVILECEPRLVPLFARSFEGVEVHACEIEAKGGSKIARYDWLKQAGGAGLAVELATLPRYLRRNFDDFPDTESYLVADETEAAHWREWLKAQGPAPYIGLCWRSGNVSGLRAQQYAPLEAWAAFARDLPGTLISLQYDARDDEIARLQTLSGRTIAVPPLDQKNEIDRTSALMANLDAAVSAPTAVSWMSAGLGVKTFKILYNTSWTAFGRDYEPFAPACRCIRPETSGDWADAFAKARAALI